MKRHLWGLAVVGVLIGVAGCAGDPTESISGTAARIVPTYSKLFLFPGDSVIVTAEVRDEQGGSLPVDVTAASSDASVAAVVDDPLAPVVQARFWVRGDGVGGAKVTLTAGGLSSEILVSVFPDVFQGDVAVSTTAILDTVTIGVGSSGLKFVADTAGGADLTTVAIDDEPARILSLTPDEVKVLAMSTGALTDVALTISNMVFLEGTEYESTIGSLDAENPISISGEDNEPGNDDPASGTAITVGGAALEGLITESDIDDFFVFTLAAPATVSISVVFDGGGGDPDLDVFVLSAAGAGFCVLDGCAMATGSQPEEFTGTLPAGTYTVLIEYYDSGDATAPFWYRIRIE